MIVKMKKLTLFCLASKRMETLDRLAHMGAVQVETSVMADSAERPQLAAELTRIDRVAGAIRSFPAPEHKQNYKVSGKALLNEIDAKLETHSSLTKTLDSLLREESALAPWGEFDPLMIKKMAKKGIFVYLCEASTEEIEAIELALPDTAALKLLGGKRNRKRFAVVASAPVDDLPTVHLPADKSLAEVQTNINEVNAERAELAKKISEAYGALPKLAAYRAQMEGEFDFISARDAIQDHGEISVLTGFIPARECERLTEEAHKNGWGISFTDPGEEEPVPVLLDLPRWLNPIRPLLEFLGILPGYREIDVSLPMIIFMSIFFAMIINDAGYSILYLAVALVIMYIARHKVKIRQAAALLALFSMAGFVWGVLAGGWFGIEWGGLKFLTNESTRNGNIQFVCFTIAMIHMSIGHISQLFRELKIRNILSQIGWLLVLAGFYIIATKVIAYPGEPPKIANYLLGTGIGLLLVFHVRWMDFGSIFNFPFDIINCFTDILSYIRLFAIGIAGGHMAASFNMMSWQIMDSGWWAIPLGILLVLVAHLLNLTLGMVSVLVHGVRLNTLEFSNHIGVTWSGNEFKPLKKS